MARLLWAYRRVGGEGMSSAVVRRQFVYCGQDAKPEPGRNSKTLEAAIEPLPKPTRGLEPLTEPRPASRLPIRAFSGGI
jgi:hypothetical protein